MTEKGLADKDIPIEVTGGMLPRTYGNNEMLNTSRKKAPEGLLLVFHLGFVPNLGLEPGQHAFLSMYARDVWSRWVARKRLLTRMETAYLVRSTFSANVIDRIVLTTLQYNRRSETFAHRDTWVATMAVYLEQEEKRSGHNQKVYVSFSTSCVGDLVNQIIEQICKYVWISELSGLDVLPQTPGS